MYFHGETFITGVLAVLGGLFVLVCMVFIGMIMNHFIKTCRARFRPRRNVEELEMSSISRSNSRRSQAPGMLTPLDANHSLSRSNSRRSVAFGMPTPLDGNHSISRSNSRRSQAPRMLTPLDGNLVATIIPSIIVTPPTE